MLTGYILLWQFIGYVSYILWHMFKLAIIYFNDVTIPFNSMMSQKQDNNLTVSAR